jgi:hypothetical protein
MINPTYVLLAKDLDVTVTEVSYLTTISLLFSGITPVFLVPYANVYGWRNLYVVSDTLDSVLQTREQQSADHSLHRCSLSSLQYPT